MADPRNIICTKCGHKRGDHIPTRDAPDGEQYPGQCNLCSCWSFLGAVELNIAEGDWEVIRTNDGHSMNIRVRPAVVIRSENSLSPEDLDDLKEVSTKIRGINSMRSLLTEFRITFGWNQPHGPYPRDGETPGDPHGHYTTIFTSDEESVRAIAYTRYGPKWSQIYRPEQWRTWTAMDDCKELEKIQFHYAYPLPPWPEKHHFHAGIILGRPR